MREALRGALLTSILAGASVMLLPGCAEEPAQYRFGQNVTARLLGPLSPGEGIHPDRSVLADPAHPFGGEPVSAAVRWQLLPAGAPVAAFYAFATALVYEPTGEHQYYTAQALAQVAGTGAVAPGVDVAAVRERAIDAYRSVLEQFPDAISYDATGTYAYGLATPAYQAIVALGGTPPAGWVLVATPDGGAQAVRVMAPAQEE